MTILNILEEIGSNKSKNHKLTILEANKDNKLLKRVIFLALDPNSMFYMKKIPNYKKEMNNQVVITLSESLDLLEQHITTRKITGTAAEEAVISTLRHMSSEDAEVFKRVLLKDLRCGIAGATVNKVWKNLVKEYPIMLCSQRDEKAISKIKFPAYVQLKMDGMRFNAVVNDGEVLFYTGNGKMITLLSSTLQDQFLKLASRIGLKSAVFDGELVVFDECGNIANRQTGNGVLNKAVKGTISESESQSVHAIVWDVFSYKAFIEGAPDNTPYSERLGVLQEANFSDLDYIEIVKNHEVPSLEYVLPIYQAYLEEGQEGIILKDKNGIWENKRVKSQIKFKNESTCELLVTDWIEGTGRYEGLLGALSCQSSDGRLSVNVGSGFNDVQRSEITRESIVGKIVEVKYNGKIVNKNGGNSLFLPIFVRIREDKDVANNVDEIS